MQYRLHGRGRAAAIAITSVNYYSLTKTLDELAARAAPRSVVIRCAFKPRPWEHAKGFVDMWTSGDYVDEIAPLIAKVVENYDCLGKHDTIHIGTGRKRIFDLARSTREVESDLREIAPVTLPMDTSLDTSKYDELFGDKKVNIDFARVVFGDEERAAVNRVMAGYWRGLRQRERGLRARVRRVRRRAARI